MSLAPTMIDDALLAKVYSAIFRELSRNLRPPAGHLKGKYAVPGGKYQKSWLWDAAFISQIWLLADPFIAKEVLLTHMEAQLENGMIPHMVSPNYRSPVTQSPLLAWAAWNIYEKTGSEEIIRRAYPRLKSFIDWFYSNRDFDGDGLFSWVRSDESWDDSPRFDGIKIDQVTRYSTHPRIHRALVRAGSLPFFRRLLPQIHPELGDLDIREIQALDLNCLLVNEMNHLLKMGRVLGLDSDVKLFERRIAALVETIRDRLWDPADNFFYDLSPRGFIRIKTPAAFYALFAEVASKGQANALVEHLTDENEFWAPYPVPTVAVNDPKFSLKYWRGPTWVNINYLVYLGLKKYGFDDLAGKLSEKTVEMVAQTYHKTGRFYEFYNPFTGGVEGLTPKPVENFVGWTGLVANLIVERS